MNIYHIRYESDLYSVVVNGNRIEKITRYNGPENRLGEDVLYRDLDEQCQQKIVEHILYERNRE